MRENEKLLQIMTDAVNKGEDWTIRVAEYINNLEQQLAAANAQLEQARATIDTHSELAEHYKRRAEQAERENKRLRVCGNCRHFSTGYTESYCVKANNRETLRQNTCRDWEMV